MAARISSFNQRSIIEAVRSRLTRQDLAADRVGFAERRPSLPSCRRYCARVGRAVEECPDDTAVLATRQRTGGVDQAPAAGEERPYRGEEPALNQRHPSDLPGRAPQADVGMAPD